MGAVGSNQESRELVNFGSRCELGEFPSIAVGGFIDFGDMAASNILPREELQYASPREEAGSTAGSRERPQAEASSARSPTHAEQRWLSHLGLEELMGYYPGVYVEGCSSGLLSLTAPVGLFRGLRSRGLLVLEVPGVEKLWKPMFAPADRLVPDVRAWAFWGDGTLVRSHHTNPDLSICACLPWEWVLGHNPLIDFVSFCTCWFGKALFETRLGYWPGPQHFGPRARRLRGKLDEFCGCGGQLRYHQCCHEKDSALSLYELCKDSWEAEGLYLTELARQGRPRYPKFVKMRWKS
jgi:hypothetical protein